MLRKVVVAAGTLCLSASMVAGLAISASSSASASTRATAVAATSCSSALASTRSFLRSLGYHPPGGSGKAAAAALIAYSESIIGNLPGAARQSLEQKLVQIHQACGVLSLAKTRINRTRSCAGTGRSALAASLAEDTYLGVGLVDLEGHLVEMVNQGLELLGLKLRQVERNSRPVEFRVGPG